MAVAHRAWTRESGAMTGAPTKTDLRRRMLAARDLVAPQEAHAAAATVARSGLALVRRLCAPGACVAAYWPIRSELSTRPLIEALHAAGFRMALPTMHSATRILSFRAFAPGDELAKGPLGLSEPLAASPSATPDLIFVPLAVFDAAGARIGYGGGHCDATLQALRAQGSCVAVGLAYDRQETDSIPAEGHDEKLDFVLTENRLVKVRG